MSKEFVEKVEKPNHNFTDELQRLRMVIWIEQVQDSNEVTTDNLMGMYDKCPECREHRGNTEYTRYFTKTNTSFCWTSKLRHHIMYHNHKPSKEFCEMIKSVVEWLEIKRKNQI